MLMETSSKKTWEMPPLIKIYEALGAVADGRVRIDDETHARVSSSDRASEYVVESSEDWHEVSSSDNASYWQGYLGYPAVAVLIARGFFSPQKETLAALAAVAWKELNRRHKGDYSKTISEVQQRILERGYHPEAVEAEARELLAALRVLKPCRGRRLRPTRKLGANSGKSAVSRLTGE
jgi:hypothetical protein